MAFLIPGSVLLIEPVEDRLFFRIGNAFSMVCYGEAEILFFKEDFQVYGFSLAGVLSQRILGSSKSGSFRFRGI